MTTCILRPVMAFMFFALVTSAQASARTDDAASGATVLRIMDQVNARLALSGSSARLTEASLLRLGSEAEVLTLPGVGSTWSSTQITYALDDKDLPAGLSPSEVERTFVRSFESWNRASFGRVIVDRVEQESTNHDVLDAPTFAEDGTCLDIVDSHADESVLLGYDPETKAFDISPHADIFVGGWLGPEYFSRCLRNAELLAITWTFSGPDRDGDTHPDKLYVEQYFNEGYRWTTSMSRSGELLAPIDLESIVMHEIGHAHGLGHLGETTARSVQEALEIEARQPGQSFRPTAVMNPFYLGGEKRRLSPIDIRAFRRLYSPKFPEQNSPRQ